ncbi:MAG: DUF4230 domain-containing protein [Sphingobacteriaceae bacterium]|nr:DUF4230 domain-containing protein [Cytophagaceae bacterium]
MELLTILLALLLGALGGYAGFSFFHRRRRNEQALIRTESTVLLERIEKVFKVVLAEGHFSEIYDHRSDKEFLWILKVPKKALIVARAKVLVGFDFGKVAWRWVEGERKVVIDDLPPPEILSMDSDYKFYDIDQDSLLNPFTSKDYTNLLTDAKQVMHTQAIASELPKIATRQLHLLIDQLALSMNWQVEFRLDAAEQKQLTEKIGFGGDQATPPTLSS